MYPLCYKQIRFLKLMQIFEKYTNHIQSHFSFEYLSGRWQRKSSLAAEKGLKDYKWWVNQH